MSNEKNQSINMLKGIACIGVVFIHVPFPGLFGQSVIALSRVGVALFFVISGYFLYQSDDEKVFRSLPKKIKRTFKLMVLAFLIYFLWESFVRFFGGGIQKVIQWYINDVFSLKNFIKFIIISYDPIVGHLWFLVALLESYLLFWIILKLKLKIHIISAFLLLEIHIGLMSFSFVNVLNWNMCIFRSVWFYGFPFMVIGYSLKRKQDSILNVINTPALICVAIVGLILTLVERFLIGNLQIFNGSLLMVIAAFLLAIKYPGTSKENIFARLGEKNSTYIYIYHWIIKEIVIKIQKKIILSQYYFIWIAPLVVLFLSMGISMVIVFVKERVRNTSKL